MKHPLASNDQMTAFLAENSAWSIRQGKLHRRFLFTDFVTAFGFMTQAALMAESANHHPEWSNSYNSVEVDLTSHDSQGITEKDFALARSMDEIARQFILK